MLICALAVTALWGQAQEPPAHPRAAGSQRYRLEGCAQCHTTGAGTRRAGPVLPSAVPRSPEWHLAHLHDPRSVSPGSTMPAYRHLFEPDPAAEEVRRFVGTYDSRDGSMDQDGIVTQREYERAGGASWESELSRLDSGDGVVSMADGAPRPSFELKALIDHLVQLQPTGPIAERGTAAPAGLPSIERGERLYLRHCAGCHGARADGNGPAAPFFGDYPPRNFLRGEYRYRSTLAPEPPTDADLFRTIRRGVGPSMPAWPHFSDGQVWDLVEFLKSNHPGYLHRELFIEGEDVQLAFVLEPSDVEDPAGADLEGGRV
ncbi:MAG: c-type cytochrome, partial [Planctomycetota bacterium]